MRKQRISNALSNIQDKYILETALHKKRAVNSIWFRMGSVAACLILVIGFLIWKKQPDLPKTDNTISVTDNGVTIPKLKISISENSSANMIAFFIYQGRVYVQDEWLSNAHNLIGEHLGTATGSINEWTKKEDYVELSGSVYGDFYSVQGYDPSFMLCMSHDDGTVSTYVNNNGITLKYGSELFEDRLHIHDNLEKITYQTRNDWFYDTGITAELKLDNVEIDAFLNALNSAEFMLLDDIPLNEDDLSVYDAKEIYHLFLKMKNGMIVHLRIFEGGYVNYDGINGICVKVDSEKFNEFINLLR